MPKTLTTEEKNKEAIAKRIDFINQIDSMWYAIESKSSHPGRDEISDMLDICTCVRANKFRFIDGPRKADKGLGNLLFHRLRFHGAIKTKHKVSAIKNSWQVDRETYRKLDTLAVLISVSQGNINSEWGKLLGMHAKK